MILASARFFCGNFIAMGICVWLSGMGTAQADNPLPDIAEFDGSNGVSLPGHLSLDIIDSGTIEFHVAATWKGVASHDPVILSALTPVGPRYAVAISGDKQAIGLARNEDWDMTEFDFSDGRFHHVAFVVINGITDVYIDGEHEDSLLTGFGDQEVSSFHLASLNGEVAPFQGKLAGLRIWDAPLDPEDLTRFSKINIFSPEGLKHPDIEALIAVGDFSGKAATMTLMYTDGEIFQFREPDASAEDVAEMLPMSEADLAAAAAFDAENEVPDPAVEIREVFNQALEVSDDNRK